MRTELEKIYLERENKMIELIKTLSWEESRTIVDEEYKEQLLSICPEKPLKRGFCIDGKPVQFEIVDARSIALYDKQKNKSTYLIKDADSSIKGKATYARICIKRLSY